MKSRSWCKDRRRGQYRQQGGLRGPAEAVLLKNVGSREEKKRKKENNHSEVGWILNLVKGKGDQRLDLV